jgi:hypothetical protein
MNLCGCGCGVEVKKKFVQHHHIRHYRPNFNGAKPFKIDGVLCRLIPLSQGLVTIVDATDYEELSQFYWTAHWDSKGRRFYVHSGHNPTVIMHRMVVGGGEHTDHINGNSLDNRRANLRPATVGQNQFNSKPRGSREFKGINLTPSNKWQAEIQINKKKFYLGTFASKRDAILAYNAAATKHYGEFAYLNHVPQEGV